MGLNKHSYNNNNPTLTKTNGHSTLEIHINYYSYTNKSLTVICLISI